MPQSTVIVNSSVESRLQKIFADLQYPSKLVLVQGDLLPGTAQETVATAMEYTGSKLNHVVSHGAVRYWTEMQAGCDETFSLESTSTKKLLDMDPDEFAIASTQLAKMHLTAAQTLLPQMATCDGGDSDGDSDGDGGTRISLKQKPTYTFVTGDGGGHRSGKRSSTGEINSHHIWGLSAALRSELESSNVVCREVRVGLPINRSMEERANEPRVRPLSADICDLCAGVASSGGENMRGQLLEINSQNELEDYLGKFNADKDKSINLPHGSL